MDDFVILDRDGVINVDLMTYVTKPEDFEPIKGSLEAIALLNKSGYKIAIATNQACIEKQIITENELEAVHDHMVNLLNEVGGKIAPIIDECLEYGQYLTRITGCYECHGGNLAGKDPDSEGSPGPNITRKGNPGNWNFGEFKKAMQTGQTPEGKTLNPEKMPWPHYAVMSDIELRSLWLSLNSI